LNIGHEVPHFEAKYLPPPCEKMETIEILIQPFKSTAALAELKKIAKIIPNQAMLINAIVL